MPETITSLIEKLEGAVSTGIIFEREAVALQRALGLEDTPETDWKQCCWDALKGSIDSAMALANWTLEQRGPININICLAGSAQVVIDDVGPCDPAMAQVVAQNAALALIIALLRAQSEARV
ncbi:hypothetical protein ABIB58_002831 [Brevundimonas sp. UYEF29]|uniref:hypothetical protein n=1 Tax=Brevundimonas sp. UYEF29 TaxID=3156346 RepID=UPI00339B1207